MKLAIVCDELLKEEFLRKKIKQTDTCFVATPAMIPEDASVIFDLLFENLPTRISLLKQFLPRPIFINAIGDTLAGMGEPFIRINAWPTFLQREIAELAILPGQENLVQTVMEALGWKYLLVPDIAGMISPRIVAGIINEAYHALEEKVSSPAEIDTALKTGTNYPFGPFEWSRLIGPGKVYELLLRLNQPNQPAALLAKEAASGIKK